MKERNIVLLFNLVWSLIVFICWISSIETMSGCACEYWRCSSGLIDMVPVLLLVQCIINILMFVSFSEYLYGEENGEKK